MIEKNKRVMIIAFISVLIFWVSFTQAQEAAVSDEIPIGNKIEYKSEDLRDPFQEEGAEIEVIKKLKEEQAPTKPLPSLEIQGIVWGGRFPQAIINNKVLKIGDMIGEVRIVDITKKGVTVIFENREYDLSSPASLNLQGPKKSPKGG